MVEINTTESIYRRKNRELHDKVVSAYLGYGQDILSKKYPPYTVADAIARAYDLTKYGVIKILKRRGIYESAENPVVFPKDRTVSLALSSTSNDPCCL